MLKLLSNSLWHSVLICVNAAFPRRASYMYGETATAEIRVPPLDYGFFFQTSEGVRKTEHEAGE